jgi:hypothetical protein
VEAIRNHVRSRAKPSWVTLGSDDTFAYWESGRIERFSTDRVSSNGLSWRMSRSRGMDKLEGCETLERTHRPKRNITGLE